MSDPGGGHGWRTGRALGYRRIAERAEPVFQQPLCVLLLPRPVEEMGAPVEELLAAPGVAAVEPPRLTAAVFAGIQARRLKLPGFPRAIAVFDPQQYPLARALRALHPDAELWTAGEDFDPAAGARPLFERMERLGIESGRLGSERVFRPAGHRKRRPSGDVT